jgi:SAM-dependent methyltransferase
VHALVRSDSHQGSSIDTLAVLAGRSRCPVCGSGPLSIGDDALVCSACERRWQILSRRPLAVRLATEGVDSVGEQFRGPPVAHSRVRRAVWRWHARREERFASHVPALPDSQLTPILHAFEALPAGRRSVLDVGGGSGRWRALLGNPADYTIADVAAPETLPLDPDSTYVVGDAAALPFAAGTFDLVLMIEVLQHLPEPARALAEAGRVLTPSGVLVATARQAWRTHGAPNDYFRFTRYGLEQLLGTSGLRRTQLIALGGPASVVTVALENNLPVLTKPFVKQLVSHQLWRLAALLDRLAFGGNLAGPSPETSGWLLIAHVGRDEG